MAYGKPVDPSAELKEKLKQSDASDGTSPLHGAWLLCGEETYLSSHYRTLIRRRIIPDPDMGYFDHIRLSGTEKSESSLGARVAAACAGLPVMNPNKLIEIAEPCFSEMKAADLKEFCAAIEALPDFPYVVLLILCAEEEFETADYRAPQGTVWKALVKAGMHIVPFSYQDKAKLRTWCARHFASESIECAPYLIDAMIDYIGISMSSLSGEMQKLCAYLHAHGRNTVAEQDIPRICCKNESTEDFGIQTAIRNRDIRALSNEYRIAKQEHTDAMTLFFRISAAITELYKIKVGLSEGYTREELARIYKMKDYPMRLAVTGCGNYTLPTLTRLQELCAETDVLLKSTPLDGYVLIERLICAMTKLYETASATDTDTQRNRL